ncbi:hypothetical protein C0993_010510, partial [Termitomyces sp. T159_Od127]
MRLLPRARTRPTGPFPNALFTMYDTQHTPSCSHRAESTLRSQTTTRLLDPSTSNGRVIFFLPEQGNTIVEAVRVFRLEGKVRSGQNGLDNYGDCAWTVCSLAERSLHGTRLSPQYPSIDTEVRDALTHEVLAWRTRLAFLNVHAVLPALHIMAAELGWSRAAGAFFESMRRMSQRMP